MAVTHAPGGPLYRITFGAADEYGAPLTPSQQNLLRHCATFRSLEQLRRVPGFTRNDLDTLVSAGLIETDAAILRDCATLAEPCELAPIADLGILTCGSPKLLERSVTSWTEFARSHERDLRITIIDDSPADGPAAAQRATTRALEEKLGIEVRFIGPDSRVRIAAELARRSGVDGKTVQFALAGRPQPRIGIGGSRNLLMLLTRGRRVLSADDDIVARFERPPPHELTLWILSEEVPVITRFFESVAETDSTVHTSLEPDALRLHEAFLGHTVAEAAARLEGPASLAGAQPPLTAAIRQRDVRIAVTALGLVGDSASDCAAFFSMLATGENEKNFLARPTRFSPSREVLRRPCFPVLCQGVYLMTYCHAFDNTLPLPPYFPIGRGEDQVWQKLLHQCLPDTVVAHLPMAACHRPAGARTYARSDYLDPCASFPDNAFLLGALGAYPPPPAELGSDRRLDIIGGHVADMARDRETFSAHLRGAWGAYLQYHHDLVATALDSRPGHAAWWRDSLADTLGRLREQMQNPIVPLAYASCDRSTAVNELRLDVARFAELLKAWPTLREAAESYAESAHADPGWLRP